MRFNLCRGEALKVKEESMESFASLAQDMPNVYLARRLLQSLTKPLTLSLLLVHKRYTLKLRKGSFAAKCYEWDKVYRERPRTTGVVKVRRYKYEI